MSNENVKKIRSNSTVNPSDFASRFKELISSRIGLLLISILFIFIVFTIIDPIYIMPRNLVNIVEQSVINGFLAVGITFAIVLAGIDLSIGSIFALTIVFVAQFLVAGVNPYIALIFGVLIGAIFGSINGLLITKLKLQPFIATLGTMSAYRGIAYIATNGEPIVNIPGSYRNILNGDVFGSIIPISIIVLIVFVIVMEIFLKKTRIGTYIYSVGGNEESAFLSGIKIDKVKIIGYAISGIGGALAGMVTLAQLGTGEPIAGQGYELNAIAATAIAGTSLAGGKGSPFAAFLGAILLSALKVGLIVAQVPTFWQYVATGAIIIVAASAEIIQKRLEKKAA